MNVVCETKFIWQRWWENAKKEANRSLKSPTATQIHPSHHPISHRTDPNDKKAFDEKSAAAHMSLASLRASCTIRILFSFGSARNEFFVCASYIYVDKGWREKYEPCACTYTPIAESDPSLIPTHPSRKEKKPVLKARADFLQPRQCSIPVCRSRMFLCVRAIKGARVYFFTHTLAGKN